MRDLTAQEIRPFLLHSTRTAKLATVGADGLPHVVPVWFVLDGPDVVITTMSGSLKARNLARQPAVSLCVDDERPPYAFVTLHGHAILHPRPPDLLDWTTRVAHRYLGAENAVEAGKRYAEIDDLVVRITIDRIIARTEIAG
jgi:PPOX class probable F420-dependent enzyme